jgi:hypothetical protein
MKKFLLLISISFFTFFCNPRNLSPTSLEFQNDLASENNRIAGVLSRQPEFNRNLESLTYDYYIEYLKNNIAISAEEIIQVITKSDTQQLVAKQYSFSLSLLYKSDRTIICDISNTAFIDSVHTYDAEASMPTLEEFLTDMNY